MLAGSWYQCYSIRLSERWCGYLIMNLEMKNKKFEEEYEREFWSGLKLFAWIVGTWVFFGVIMLLIFL